MTATIEQLLEAVDRFRSDIISNAKSLADIGPYSYKKLTKDVLSAIDKARKAATKGDADAIWEFDELWDNVSSEIETVDEGGNLGLADYDYFNDVSELSLELGVQLGIWQPKNKKGGYDWTPEWEAKIEAENPTPKDNRPLLPFCKLCGQGLKYEGEYHVCGTGNIEIRPIKPPEVKSWLKE